MFRFANKYKSPKNLINAVKPIENNWDNVLLFNYYNPGLNFYLNKIHINTTKDLNELKFFVNNIDDFKFSDINFLDYQHYPAIKAPVSK